MSGTKDGAKTRLANARKKVSTTARRKGGLKAKTTAKGTIGKRAVGRKAA